MSGPSGADATRDSVELAQQLDALLMASHVDQRAFASALLAAVEAKGLAECARACGMSCINLHRQLSGRRGLTFNTVIRLVGALGLGLRVGMR